MSRVHEERICPLMSRAISIPPRYHLRGDHTEIEIGREDRLIEIPCKGRDCSFWLVSEEICCYPFAAIMVGGVYNATRIGPPGTHPPPEGDMLTRMIKKFVDEQVGNEGEVDE